jgi:hypothetical protein
MRRKPEAKNRNHRGRRGTRREIKNSPLINTDDTDQEEIAKVAEIENRRLFSVPPCLRGEDWVSRIQQLASK